jgi:hypothetical protein
MHKKVTRIITGPDGKSHFEESELTLECRLGTGPQAETIEVTGVTVWEKGPRQDHDWHNAPRRLLLIGLEGDTEMEVGDGTKHRFKAGELILAEDTTGQGHVTRALGDKGRKAVIVYLD